MDIIVKGHEYFYDITSMSMLFFPGEKTEYVTRSNNDTYIRSILNLKNGKHICTTTIKYHGKKFVAKKTSVFQGDTKEIVKFSFYKACSKATGITSPWGTLTGIRPISVYARLTESGFDAENLLLKQYLVSKDKLEILKNIYLFQKSIINNDKRDVSIYISIPFCPSKCTYCSFISVSAVNKDKLLKEYVDLLVREIKLKSELVKKYNLNIKSLYIGGGTPGILSKQQLEVILSAVSENFDIKEIQELCFEMGRPDTVSKEKLLILKKYGFHRICINTQTTNDLILKNVNRHHCSGDYINAVLSSQQVGFDSINTDLIAGLPGETTESFKKSLADVVATGVDNITVHTLAIKRSAELSLSDEYYNPTDKNVDEMVDFAYGTLKQNGYVPYYIYRQKNCVSNGENIGFCKPDTPCLYNIYMMEDVHSVIACGAGASSKIINGTNVQRVINVKYPMDYVADFDKIVNNTEKTDNILKTVFFNEQ